MVDPKQLRPPHDPLEPDSEVAIASRLIRAMAGPDGGAEATGSDSGEFGPGTDAIEALATLIAERLTGRSVRPSAAPFSAGAAAANDAAGIGRDGLGDDLARAGVRIEVYRETIGYNSDTSG